MTVSTPHSPMQDLCSAVFTKNKNFWKPETNIFALDSMNTFLRYIIKTPFCQGVKLELLVIRDRSRITLSFYPSKSSAYPMEIPNLKPTKPLLDVLTTVTRPLPSLLHPRQVLEWTPRTRLGCCPMKVAKAHFQGETADGSLSHILKACIVCKHLQMLERYRFMTTIHKHCKGGRHSHKGKPKIHICDESLRTGIMIFSNLDCQEDFILGVVFSFNDNYHFAETRKAKVSKYYYLASCSYGLLLHLHELCLPKMDANICKVTIVSPPVRDTTNDRLDGPGEIEISLKSPDIPKSYAEDNTVLARPRENPVCTWITTEPNYYQIENPMAAQTPKIEKDHISNSIVSILQPAFSPWMFLEDTIRCNTP
ncbi:hypothetical protein RF11_02684 [Thelohanellus kitauei]|uniref:Uncharacterized protein n=1 Tax=Thelohanellus kitauei TaxID=669202 RepID=A0A0C2MM13_THEKT|nr:hypothetical protein RF11_02684 [Thelohanellus kitauei]